MNKLKYLILFLFLIIIYCGDSDRITYPSPEGIPHIVNINSNELVMEASLNRDFMPACPPNGRPLSTVINISDIHSLPISDSVRVDSLWVINGIQVWATILEEYSREDNGSTIIAGNATGPKWEPESRANVIVKVTAFENSYYFKAENVIIGSSY